MPKRNRSPRARAEHCRELAVWTDDARTQHILLDLARELEAEESAEPAAEDLPLNIPPSLS
jgi:hypothetical protein